MWDIDVTYRTELSTTFERLFEKVKVLEQARPLPSIALLKIKEALSIEWTYNSNSIENHEHAIDYLYTLIHDGYILNSKDILSLHGLMLRSIEDDFAGRLRHGGVRISGANFVPPNANKVSQLLDDLVDFVVTNRLQLNTIELATFFHHKFVWIHPFF